METISNINEIKLDREQEPYVYILVKTIELYKEIYSQIMLNDCGNIDNQSAWIHDWQKGTEYVEREFNERYNEDFGAIVLSVNTVQRNKIVVGLIPKSGKILNMPRYDFSTNEYEIDLI